LREKAGIVGVDDGLALATVENLNCLLLGFNVLFLMHLYNVKPILGEGLTELYSLLSVLNVDNGGLVLILSLLEHLFKLLLLLA